MNDLLQVRIEGPLAPHRDGLWARLRERGYTPLSARNLLRVLAHLSQWLRRQNLRPDLLTEHHIEDYLRHRREAGYVHWLSLRGLDPILEHLRSEGAVPPRAVPGAKPAPIEGLLARYARYLEQERGLTSSVVRAYEHHARSFLLTCCGPATLDPSSLSAADVVAWVQEEVRSSSLGFARLKLSALRSFLRFLHLSGDLPRDLTGVVPCVAGSTRDGLPRGADPDSVRKLICCCDLRTHVGRRNHAILLLLSRLGLRAGEVAALELDDIDWTQGHCVVRGKGGREDHLPLPKDVGQAIASYLQRGRPRTESRRVFIQTRAPHSDITRGAITAVVYQACERAGLARISPHQLRHTAATEMLRRGASLPEIAQVLRHRHLASTAIYAKVDANALRPLGRPWPGEGR